MKLDAMLDVDVLALQQDDEVTCLLTFDAPVPPDLADRPGESLVVVVDRSGSMRGEPLDAVRSSLHALVDRMKPQDAFGVVVFDDEAAVAVPTRPMHDHHLPTVHALIEGIHARGMTDLSGGYLLGLAEARRHRGATGATVLLLSDGHANAGLTDPLQVGQLAAQARGEQITTGTIGIGTGYDETLLAELATQGSGAHRFAFTPDDAAAVLAEEAGDLLSKSIVNAFVRIKPTDPGLLDRIGTLHDVPRWVEADGDGDKVIVIPLGDLYAGERRELLVHFDVPAIASLGHHQLATFTIEYVTLPALVSETITWPMAVNVVPGDEASGRVPNPSVTTARLLAEATRAKKEASEALERGDGDAAGRIMDHRADVLRRAAASIDPALPNGDELRSRLSEEEAQARKLARSARHLDAMTSRKSFMEDIQMESRGRNDSVRRDRSRGKRDF
jgi:Ca-activated chloride channel family protein